jgi:hypothetical protein
MVAYLTWWNYHPSRGSALAPAYERALEGYSGMVDARRTDELRWVEGLGAHVLSATITDLPDQRGRDWLHRWSLAATDRERATVARLTAQVASGNSSDAVRDRARGVLSARIPTLALESDRQELEAMTWVAPSEDEPVAILTGIVLPALEKTGGTTHNGPGVVKLIAEVASVVPDAAMSALRLVVDGDEYLVLCHLAAEQMERALRKLLEAHETRERCRALIHDLGGRGCTSFRGLLDEY